MPRPFLVMLALAAATAAQAAGKSSDKSAKSEGKPGTYTVGQVVNAHTLMVCASQEHMREVAAAYKQSDDAGDAKWAELEKAKTVLGEAACGRIDGSGMVKIMDLPVLVETVGEAGDRQRMTVVRMQTVDGGRTLWAAIFGDFDFVRIKNVAPDEVAGRVAGLKSKAGSDDWDREVKPLLLGAFDKDGSGMLDTEAEIKAIPCDVWKTLHRRIHAADRGSGLAWTYGFKPGDYNYVGDALGIDEKRRSAAFARIKGCGVDTGA